MFIYIYIITFLLKKTSKDKDFENLKYFNTNPKFERKTNQAETGIKCQPDSISYFLFP